MFGAGSPPVTRADGKARSSDLIVHEWGTFLSMSGSDGSTLDGMYHEEHALPAFVHSRSRDQLRLPLVLLKGETPVIYFYAPERQQVRVGVGWPRGIWTQWYPQAALVNPPLLEHAQTPDRLSGGRICWFAEVIPASEVKLEVSKKRGARPRAGVELPATSSDALWNHARRVDAAYVTTRDRTKENAPPELEKFLFYRGLGEARLPLRLNSRQNGTLSLDREETLGEGVRHIFVLRVENGRGAYSYRPALEPGEHARGVIPSMAESRPLSEFTQAVAQALADKLTDSGLYSKEARAMVNTWTTSYFQTDGVRALFVLPQSWTDAFIPMTISPQPRQIVRVMVGRLELLSEERERLAESAVRDLASGDAGKRQEAFRFLHDQGRYVEPIVRRVMRTTKEDTVRTLCRRLLLTEFVTELRAAVHNSADGKRLRTDPVLLRAHLARLLREIGCIDEARAEGEAVLAALKTHPSAPNQALANNPAALEIRAAAVEATGDDRKASVLYARRIELQLGSMKSDVDSSTIAWLRDWWVGRAYARCLLRTPTVGLTIADLERFLAQPSSRSAGAGGERSPRVRLAFLLDGQGQPDRAEPHWSSLLGKPKLEAAASLPMAGPNDAGETGS